MKSPLSGRQALRGPALFNALHQEAPSQRLMRLKFNAKCPPTVATPLFDNLPLDTLLATSELAALLRIPEKTVRNWRYKANLPAIKLGRKLVRYQWRDVIAWLKANGELRL